MVRLEGGYFLIGRALGERTHQYSYDMFEGRPKRDLVADLCERAEYVLAMGSCAAFGGIPAAPPNPSESTGLQYTNNRPGGLLGPDWRSRRSAPPIT
jgi:Ni,Fe-hydrogenase I small subunit